VKRAAVWAVLAAFVVLASRTIVYALAPWQTIALERLQNEAGGPHLAVVLAIAVGGAALLAAASLWVAAVAVRERVSLEARELVEVPRLRPARLALRAAAFFAATCVAFSLVESYLHWRAGLGFHGLHCLLGPVHRDALPVVGALSLLTVAAHGSIELLLAWVRRLVALLAARLPGYRGAPHVFRSTARPRALRSGSAAPPRGPPVGSFSTTC
jgi:hypothetical protein